MYCRAGWAAALAAAVVLTGAACRRAPAPSGPLRVAVLRFENLTPDASLDWMGRAFSEALIAQWTGVPRVYAISPGSLRSAQLALGSGPLTAPGISTERAAAIFTGATELVTGGYSVVRGQLRVYAEVEDVARGRTVRQASAVGPASAGMIPLAASLARELDANQAVPLGTANQYALRCYATALEDRDYAAASRDFSAAAEADPNFGMIYPAWAAIAIEQQDRAGAERAISLGLARSAALPKLDVARLEFLDASVRNDRAGRLKALAALERLTPQDAAIFRTAGQISLERRDYREAVRNLKRACELEIGNIQDLNQLAYAQAYTGDLAGATATLKRYQALRPRDANPLDSMGDVHLYNGQYAAAEKFYLDAHKLDPAFLGGGPLLKAAWARLMTGDISGADELFQKLATQLNAARDPLLPYRVADWAWLTGRRREAVAQLEQFANGAAQGPLREMASRAYGELAVWQLELGNRDAAKVFGDRALASATPASAPMALLARTLCEPPGTPAEWQQRVARMPAPLKDYTLAYAYLLAQDYRDAAPLLEKLYQTSQPETQQGLPVLLAWAEVGAGNWQAAAPLVVQTPIPQSTGLDQFSSLWFPRLFSVRGVVLEKQGKAAEARQNYEVFAKLSGSERLIWDRDTAANQRQ